MDYPPKWTVQVLNSWDPITLWELLTHQVREHREASTVTVIYSPCEQNKTWNYLRTGRFMCSPWLIPQAKNGRNKRKYPRTVFPAHLAHFMHVAWMGYMWIWELSSFNIPAIVSNYRARRSDHSETGCLSTHSACIWSVTRIHSAFRSPAGTKHSRQSTQS